MFILPSAYILLINAAFIVLAIIIAILLSNLGYRYSHNIGDSATQAREKRIIYELLMLLLFMSLLAATFNLLVNPA